MKKINLRGKLNLNKQTVSKLNQTELSIIKGGETGTGCHSATCTEQTLNACDTGVTITGKHTVACCGTDVMICEINYSEYPCDPSEV